MRGRRTWMVAAAVLVAACGDTETTDDRGYTKAPLEEPGLTITAEEPTEMDRLGEPIRPRVTDEAPRPEEEEESGGG